MRLLVLGGTGMLGHKVVQHLSARHEVLATVRGPVKPAWKQGPLAKCTLVPGVDAMDPTTVREAIERAHPEAVINCIGIIKQSALAKDPVPSITVNALLPHLAAQASASIGARFIHISTDCVFDGRAGSYVETDPTNAEDLYGRTKAMGETAIAGALTLRTSIIGRELHGASGLVEWFLSQQGNRVEGFRKAIFSGFPTVELVGIMERVLVHHPQLNGLYHVSAEPIDKLRLLQLTAEAFGIPIEITPSDRVVIDRSLDSSRFRQAIGYMPPAWPDLVRAMATDAEPYLRWR